MDAKPRSPPSLPPWLMPPLPPPPEVLSPALATRSLVCSSVDAKPMLLVLSSEMILCLLLLQKIEPEKAQEIIEQLQKECLEK